MLSSKSIQPERSVDFKVIKGPSFAGGLPDLDDWAVFKKSILNPDSLAFAELWFEKAVARNGVPLREDFSFEELVHYGSHLFMAKINEDKRWQTTFCGDGLVQEVGFDLTGKYIDEFADPETSVFWIKNAELITDQSRVYMELCTLEFLGKKHKHCAVLNLMLKSGSKDFPDIMLTHEAFTTDISLSEPME